MIAEDNKTSQLISRTCSVFWVLRPFRIGSVIETPPPTHTHPVTRFMWANEVYTSLGALPPARSETDLIASSLDCEQCSGRSSTYPWDTLRGDLLSLRLFCRRGGTFFPPIPPPAACAVHQEETQGRVLQPTHTPTSTALYPRPSQRPRGGGACATQNS